jgi:hypothetical protein
LEHAGYGGRGDVELKADFLLRHLSVVIQLCHLDELGNGKLGHGNLPSLQFLSARNFSLSITKEFTECKYCNEYVNGGIGRKASIGPHKLPGTKIPAFLYHVFVKNPLSLPGKRTTPPQGGASIIFHMW